MHILISHSEVHLYHNMTSVPDGGWPPGIVDRSKLVAPLSTDTCRSSIRLLPISVEVIGLQNFHDKMHESNLYSWGSTRTSKPNLPGLFSLFRGFTVSLSGNFVIHKLRSGGAFGLCVWRRWNAAHTWHNLHAREGLNPRFWNKVG